LIHSPPYRLSPPDTFDTNWRLYPLGLADAMRHVNSLYLQHNRLSSTLGMPVEVDGIKTRVESGDGFST